MSGMDSYAFAAKFRDTIATIVLNVLDANRPDYRYGVVAWINRANAECGVYFDNKPDAVVTVRMGSIQPNAVGQTVRVFGKIGDRFVDDVIGTAYDLPSNKVPVGVIAPYVNSSAPTGWLLCNGAAVSRATYSDLFAVIGVSYGAGDGASTFNVPNLQNVFLRGGTPGSTGGSDSHAHNLSSDSAGTPAGTVAVTVGSIPFSGNLNHGHTIPANTTGLTSISHNHGGTSGTRNLNQQSNTTSGGTALRLTQPDPHDHSIPSGDNIHQHSQPSDSTGSVDLTHNHGAPGGSGTFTGSALSTHTHTPASNGNIPAYVGVQYIIKALL